MTRKDEEGANYKKKKGPAKKSAAAKKKWEVRIP